MSRLIHVSTAPYRKPNLKVTFSKVKRKTITRKDFNSDREYNTYLAKALRSYINYKINNR
jgi:hypothetical protein